LRASLEKSGEDLGIRRHLVFHGQVPAGAQVRALLDESHVFVLPSRTEGLPRSMLEAMARGLPCIGTPVGGIGELISPECIVPVGSADSVAKIVETLTKNFEFFRSESARNLQRSLEYRSEILMERRLQFYDSVQSSTLRKRAA
jgi:glycosyltransferase involved in cell wall biosynthesis